MDNSEIKKELATINKLLKQLDGELSELNIKESEIIELLERNGLNVEITDLISESKKIQTNINELLSKKS